MRSLNWNSLEPERHHADVMTADVALVKLCEWMKSKYGVLENAVAMLRESQSDTVTLNGRDYMGYTELTPLCNLWRAANDRGIDVYDIYQAVLDGRWAEIDGNGRAGIILNSEGADNGEQ